MSYVKIMIHLIWSTKNREAIIRNELKDALVHHIKENSIQKGIFIDTFNCVTDHIHMLVSLGSEQTVSKIVQLIKGESSHRLNEQHIMKDKFEWQNDYFAASVSESMIDKIREYIQNQEEHHKKKSFADEYAEFVDKYGLKTFGG